MAKSCSDSGDSGDDVVPSDCGVAPGAVPYAVESESHDQVLPVEQGSQCVQVPGAAVNLASPLNFNSGESIKKQDWYRQEETLYQAATEHRPPVITKKIIEAATAELMAYERVLPYGPIYGPNVGIQPKKIRSLLAVSSNFQWGRSVLAILVEFNLLPMLRLVYFFMIGVKHNDPPCISLLTLSFAIVMKNIPMLEFLVTVKIVISQAEAVAIRQSAIVSQNTTIINLVRGLFGVFTEKELITAIKTVDMTTINQTLEKDTVILDPDNVLMAAILTGDCLVINAIFDFTKVKPSSSHMLAACKSKKMGCLNIACFEILLQRGGDCS